MPRIIDHTPHIFTVKKGIYLLEIIASTDFHVRIKKYEDIVFPAGIYYYAGSAQKNFASRIKRHIANKKKIHWHIDHITTVRTNEIKTIYYFEGAGRNVEIDLAEKLVTNLKCEIIVEKFGSSDTPESLTHLVFRSKPLSKRTLNKHYPSVLVFRL